MISSEESSMYQIEALKEENARLKQELVKVKAESLPTVIKDISDYDQIRGVLRQSEERYRQLVESANSIIIHWNLNGILFVNDYGLRYFGYAREEMIGKNVTMLVPDMESKGRDLSNLVEDIIHNPEKYEQFENENIKKNGERVWVSWTNKAILHENESEMEVLAIGHDITKNKLVEKERERLLKDIDDERLRLFTVLETVPVGILLNDNQGKIVFSNKALNESWRDSPMVSSMKEYDQYKGWLVRSGEPLRAEDWPIVRALQGEKTTNEMIDVQRMDGSRDTILMNANPLYDVNGRITGGVAVNMDITELKRTEERLRESENKYRKLASELEAILDATPVGVLVYDNEGKIVRSNAAANHFFQYTDGDRSESISKRVRKYFKIRNEDGREIDDEEMPAYRVALKGESISNTVLSLQSYKGTFWLMVNGAPHIVEGKQTGGVITLMDITSRKVAEEALKESEERFRSLADNISQLAWMADEKGWVFWYNKRWLDYTGTTFEEIQGWGWTKVHHPDHMDRVVDSFKKAVDTGEKWEDIFPLRGKDGSYRWYLSRALPIRDESGRIKQWFGTNTDITEQRLTEEALQNQNIELQKAKEKAEESDRFKTAFLANISHEIRTPMSGIMGFADLLKMPNISAESQTTYIDAIISSGKRMMNIINDLINISKIETGQIEVKTETTDINKLLDELFIFFLPEADKRRIMLKMNKELPREKSFVETDKTKVGQVISNLLKNALKYTAEGSVEFGCKIIDDLYLFYVKDTGSGIRKELFGKIFDRFEQGEKPGSGIPEGVGLGLAISKAYVEALGGNIWVDSAPSEGSSFYFTIPVKASVIPDLTVNNNNNDHIKDLPSADVLVAEDEEYIYFFINEALKLNNINAIHALNGQEAVNIVKSNPDIRLILMDGRMPVMSGMEATREINKIRPELPIIALSALAHDTDIQDALEAGCVDYITKPFEIRVLLDKIALHL